MLATAEAPVRSSAWEAQLAELLTYFPDCPEEQGDEQVVFTITLAGARYTLVREPVRALISFSPREREIIEMVATGYSNKIIADVLEISTFTVSTYLRRIFAKLNVSTRAAMVAAAQRHRNSTVRGV